MLTWPGLGDTKNVIKRKNLHGQAHNMHNFLQTHLEFPERPVAAVFGCGNPLLGDDGFGPAVIRDLEQKQCLPQGAFALDVGTAIRDYLFDYLLAEELRPKHLVVVDAVEFEGRAAGELFTIDPFDIPAKKIALEVSEAEIKKRLSKWSPPEPKISRGYLARYAKMVSSADSGAVVNQHLS